MIWILFATTIAAFGAEKRFDFREPHMGTQFRVVLYAKDRETAEVAARRAFARVAVLDRALSDYKTDSELAHVHEGATEVSVDFARAVALAEKMTVKTEGAFDFTLGRLTQLWREARKTRTLPAPEAIAQSRALTGARHVQLRGRQISLKSGVKLDFGGIGKGLAIEEAMRELKASGIRSALVAGSGDIRVSAPPPGKKGWKIGLGLSKTHVLLKDAAISTSGDSEQFVQIGGKIYSHILNPRTGLGLAKGEAVTVIAEDGPTADAWATAVRVSGRGGVIHRIGNKSSPGFPKIHSSEIRAGAPRLQEFAAYEEKVSDVAFTMLPIPGGTYKMGSEHQLDEQPIRELKIDPFWMSRTEVTWDLYDLFYMGDVDAVTAPTQPFVDPTFGLGHEGHPVISVTHHAAMEFCRWLSKATGREYRLPTEAEWEYAAGDATESQAWHAGNSGKKPHAVAEKPPNAFGLHDMLGNVSEWVMDAYRADAYALHESPVGPVDNTDAGFAYVVRGGSWKDSELRVARRFKSDISWSKRDPNFPKSIWWHTDAQHVGFRIVRPYSRPSTTSVR